LTKTLPGLGLMVMGGKSAILELGSMLWVLVWLGLCKQSLGIQLTLPWVEK